LAAYVSQSATLFNDLIITITTVDTTETTFGKLSAVGDLIVVFLNFRKETQY
jgi:hypothetical protein